MKHRVYAGARRPPFNTDPAQVQERKRFVVMVATAIGCAAGAAFAIGATALILGTVDESANRFDGGDLAKSACLFVGVPVFTTFVSVGAAALAYAPFRPSLQGGPDRRRGGDVAELRLEAHFASTHFQRPVATEPELKRQAATSIREELAYAGGD